jgi:hypothetical protein
MGSTTVALRRGWPSNGRLILPELFEGCRYFLSYHACDCNFISTAIDL